MLRLKVEVREGAHNLLYICSVDLDLAEYLTRHHEEDTPNSRRYQLTYG